MDERHILEAATPLIFGGRDTGRHALLQWIARELEGLDWTAQSPASRALDAADRREDSADIATLPRA